MKAEVNAAVKKEMGKQWEVGGVIVVADGRIAIQWFTDDEAIINAMETHLGITAIGMNIESEGKVN